MVATADPAATRTTKDVDLLVNQEDLEAISTVMAGLGYRKDDLRRLVIFVDPEEPSRVSGVHLVWAGRKFRASNALPAPSLDEAVLAPQGFRVIDLPALV